MMTTKEAAAAWGVSPRRVRVWLAEGRVKGAKRFGAVWVIPKNAPRPDTKPVGQPKKETPE